MKINLYMSSETSSNSKQKSLDEKDHSWLLLTHYSISTMFARILNDLEIWKPEKELGARK